MMHRIRVAPLLLWLSILAFAAPATWGQERGSEEARDLKAFSDRVQAYVKVQKNLEASLPALKPTKNVKQLVDHQRELAAKLADARRDARQGDIFTREVTERFRKMIHKAFEGPEGKLARRTIQRETPVKAAVLRINDAVPDDMPVTTTPPALLASLPELPPELVYRILGHALTLQDVKARLIVDFIPNAIP